MAPGAGSLEREFGTVAEADSRTRDEWTGRQALAFRKLLHLQVILKEVLRLAGGTDGLACMDFGAGNCMLSYHLRRHGGDWRTVVLKPGDRQGFEWGLGGDVSVFDGNKLSFENKCFDLIVVLDGLTDDKSDAALIEEWHRCLKADGRLIVCVRRANRWSPLRVAQSVTGDAGAAQDGARLGFTESDMFRELKDGFDVHLVRPFGKFFMSLTELLTRRALAKQNRAAPENEGRRGKVLALAGIAYRLAYQLDMFLFFTRGHRMLIMAKRRAWRPRETPVLVDGRSISEAVLSRAMR